MSKRSSQQSFAVSRKKLAMPKTCVVLQFIKEVITDTPGLTQFK